MCGLKQLSLIAVICGSWITFAQEPDMEAVMAEWTINATPGEMHKMLAAFDGSWNAEFSMWQAPGAPPEKATMVAHNEMILGGRYQVSTLKGTMSGMPFEGIATTAFDNHAGEFVGTWIDNMGTAISITRGTYEAEADAIVMRGDMYYPGMGNVNIKTVLKQDSDDQHTFTMYMVMGENEMKSMQIVYTRSE